MPGIFAFGWVCGCGYGEDVDGEGGDGEGDDADTGEIQKIVMVEPVHGFVA